MVPEDGRYFSDDTRPIEDAKKKKGTFGDDVEMKTVKEDNSAKFVGKNGAGNSNLGYVGFEIEKNKVVKLVELSGFSFLDNDVPVFR